MTPLRRQWSRLDDFDHPYADVAPEPPPTPQEIASWAIGDARDADEESGAYDDIAPPT